MIRRLSHGQAGHLTRPQAFFFTYISTVLVATSRPFRQCFAWVVGGDHQ